MSSTLQIDFSKSRAIPRKYGKLLAMLASRNIRVLTEREAQSGANPWDIICQNERRDRVLNQFIKFKTLGLGNTYIKGDWHCQRIDLLFKRLFDLDPKTKSNSIMSSRI